MKRLIKLFKHKETADNLVLINQKIVLKLDLHDDKAKQKVMKLVSTFTGIDLISMDMEENKLTIMGKVDPVKVVSKLRKKWWTYILIVSPAKEEENEKSEQPNDGGGKKKEPKKEEDGKNELANKGGDGKKEESKQKVDVKKEEAKQKGDGKDSEAKATGGKKGGKEKEEKKQEAELEIRSSYRPHNPYYYVPISMEENPNACVIC